MRAIRRPLLWTAAVVTALALPAAARAQQPLDPVQISARTAEADELDARAVRYAESNARRDWGKAAGLREKAARLRPAEDPRVFSSLQTAALIRHALDQRPAALALMEKAGESALARGDVFNAAAAFTNVAFMAIELRDAERARQYVDRGTLLSHSPLLSAPQREWLQERLAQGATASRSLAVAPAIP